MKRMLVLATLLLAMVAYAADATGKWKAKVEGPEGAMELVFNLKCEGEKVTGTVVGPMGEAPLEGTLKGDDIAFTVSMEEFKIAHKGKISGDEMKLTVDMAGQEMQMTATREK